MSLSDGDFWCGSRWFSDGSRVFEMICCFLSLVSNGLMILMLVEAGQLMVQGGYSFPINFKP
jgi:hypothetical protein